MNINELIFQKSRFHRRMEMQDLLTDMCSTLKLNRVDIQWTVKGWDLDTTQIIKSDSFKLHNGDNYLLFQNYQSLGISIKQQLQILLYDCNEHKTATAKVFVLDENQGKHELVCQKKDIEEISYLGKWYWGWNFIVNEISLKRRNENLVFHVELAYFSKPHNEPSFDVSRYCVIDKLKRLILDDYSRINENQESLLEDNVSFLIDDTEIKAHSLILGAASPYFSAMFRHKDFKENKERIVDLTNDNDVTPENFQIFLDILYGRKNIQDIEKHFLTQLCILADKFNIKELLEVCEFFLSRTITVENVNELLIFAEKYNCKLLKLKAVIYAKDNIDVIKQMPTFDDIYNNKPLLLQLL